MNDFTLLDVKTRMYLTKTLSKLAITAISVTCTVPYRACTHVADAKDCGVQLPAGVHRRVVCSG